MSIIPIKENIKNNKVIREGIEGITVHTRKIPPVCTTYIARKRLKTLTMKKDKNFIGIRILEQLCGDLKVKNYEQQ